MMKKIILSFAVLLSTLSAHAGSWLCVQNDKGKPLLDIKMTGDASGHFSGKASIMLSGAGISFPVLSITPEEPAADELARVVIAEEDPQSTLRLRIFSGEIQPRRFKSAAMLMSMAPQEFDGVCEFRP